MAQENSLTKVIRPAKNRTYRFTGWFSGILWLVAIALAACHNPFPGVLPQNDSQKITIRLSGWQSNPNEKQLLQQVIQEFERLHPTVDVKHEVINSEYVDA
jgi:multiple sugar transport system substrate-binding protein